MMRELLVLDRFTESMAREVLVEGRRELAWAQVTHDARRSGLMIALDDARSMVAHPSSRS
jgi:hypothetical protein